MPSISREEETGVQYSYTEVSTFQIREGNTRTMSPEPVKSGRIFMAAVAGESIVNILIIYRKYNITNSSRIPKGVT